MLIFSLFGLPLLLGVVGIALRELNAAMVAHVERETIDDPAAMSAVQALCSEELREARHEIDVRNRELNSLTYPRDLMNALADVFPVRAWLVRVSIAGEEVELAGKMFDGLSADDVATACQESGLLRDVKLASLKPLSGDDGPGFEFVIAGRVAGNPGVS